MVKNYGNLGHAVTRSSSSFALFSSGCWSYTVRVKDDVFTQTEYFNTGGLTTDFLAYYYIKLGFNYEFLVTPIPTGKPLEIKTRSPGTITLIKMIELQK